jgi:hypothetical protein
VEDYGGNGGPNIPTENIDLRTLTVAGAQWGYSYSGTKNVTLMPLVMDYIGKTADQSKVLGENTDIPATEWLKLF